MQRVAGHTGDWHRNALVAFEVLYALPAQPSAGFGLWPERQACAMPVQAIHKPALADVAQSSEPLRRRGHCLDNSYVCVFSTSSLPSPLLSVQSAAHLLRTDKKGKAAFFLLSQAAR